jgi:hypothetical protein
MVHVLSRLTTHERITKKEKFGGVVFILFQVRKSILIVASGFVRYLSTTYKILNNIVSVRLVSSYSFIIE